MKKQKKYLVKPFVGFVMALLMCVSLLGISKVYATEGGENSVGDGETVSITIDNSVSHLAIRFYPDTNDMENFNGVGVGETQTFTVPKDSVARIRLYVRADGYYIPDDYVIAGATRLTNDDRVNYGWCRAAFTIAADETKTIVISEASVCEHPYVNPNVRWGYYDRGDGTHAQSCTLCASDVEGTIAKHTLTEMTPTEYADWYYDDSNFANMSEEEKAARKASMIESITKKLGVDANTKINCCTLCEHFEKIETEAPIEDGLHQAEDGTWYYYLDGKIATHYTGLVQYYDAWFYVENGVLNWNYTGLVNYNGVWFYVQGGQLNWGYTGLVQHYDAWFYVQGGQLNWGYTGLVNYNDIWFYVENGQLNWNYTGLVQHYDAWFYVEGGQLNWNYTGLVMYNDVWFYVENGQLNWAYTGLTCYNGVWFYVEGGMLNWGYTGLAQHYDAWFYVEGGILNWNFTGLALYNNIWFYVENGQLNWGFTGNVYFNGTWWYVENGIMVRAA